MLYYLLKFNYRENRKMCEICSKLTIKNIEQRARNCIKSNTLPWHCSGVFIVNFEQISHVSLVFLLLTLNK